MKVPGVLHVLAFLTAVVAAQGYCSGDEVIDHPDGCNKCYCNEKTQELVCSEKKCGLKSLSKKPSLKSIPSGKECVVGEAYWMEDGCNWCICEPNRKSLVCTRMRCGKSSKKYGLVKRDTTTGTCTPGEKITDTDGCNWCYCSDDGKSLRCTQKGCKGKHGITKRESQDNSCVPGEDFMDDCNRCHCGPDGNRETAACTMMHCVTILSKPVNAQ